MSKTTAAIQWFRPHVRSFYTNRLQLLNCTQFKIIYPKVGKLNLPYDSNMIPDHPHNLLVSFTGLLHHMRVSEQPWLEMIASEYE